MTIAAPAGLRIMALAGIAPPRLPPPRHNAAPPRCRLGKGRARARFTSPGKGEVDRAQRDPRGAGALFGYRVPNPRALPPQLPPLYPPSPCPCSPPAKPPCPNIKLAPTPAPSSTPP